MSKTNFEQRSNAPRFKFYDEYDVVPLLSSLMGTAEHMTVSNGSETKKYVKKDKAWYLTKDIVSDDGTLITEIIPSEKRGKHWKESLAKRLLEREEFSICVGEKTITSSDIQKKKFDRIKNEIGTYDLFLVFDLEGFYLFEMFKDRNGKWWRTQECDKMVESDIIKDLDRWRWADVYKYHEKNVRVPIDYYDKPWSPRYCYY